MPLAVAFTFMITLAIMIMIMIMFRVGCMGCIGSGRRTRGAGVAGEFTKGIAALVVVADGREGEGERGQEGEEDRHRAPTAERHSPPVRMEP